jgi:inorganic pyrophosphatase
MRIDAISIGINPPHDVNVIIEVPVGGEPIKYEMDKDAGTLVVDRFLTRCPATATPAMCWSPTPAPSSPAP